MSDVVTARAPGWLRIVAGLGLLWNLIGVYFYLVAVGTLAAPEGYDRSMAEAMPTWVTGTFAVCVFAGLLGSLGLLMLKRWSKLVLMLSLVAILAQDVWLFALRPADTPPPDLVMPAIVTLIGVVLVWLAYSADRKGWLS
jgi:uncharacterized membrane protein